MEKLTSRKNPVCVHLKKLGANKSYRDEQGCFVCEGTKMFDEAVKSGAQIEYVLSSEQIKHKLHPDTRAYYAHGDMIDSLSQLKNHQGVLFSCRYIQEKHIDFRSGTHILLDDIQDPGNVGTIIRSAFAFGIKSVILTGGSADIYNPKTVRASMGALFKQQVGKVSNDEIFELKRSGIKFIGTSSSSEFTDIKHIDLNDAIIVIGNEGRGISNEIIDICDKKTRIPLSPESESLNAAVAASIIMWEASNRA